MPIEITVEVNGRYWNGAYLQEAWRVNVLTCQIKVGDVKVAEYLFTTDYEYAPHMGEEKLVIDGQEVPYASDEDDVCALAAAAFGRELRDLFAWFRAATQPEPPRPMIPSSRDPEGPPTRIPVVWPTPPAPPDGTDDWIQGLGFTDGAK